MEYPKALPLLVFLLFPFTGNSQSQLIVWDVGQGSSSTVVTKNACNHFDAGGEASALELIEKLCIDKASTLRISHYDWDHISFAVSLLRNPKVCAILPSISHSKKWFNRFKDRICKPKSQTIIKSIYHSKKPSRDRNATSVVYSWKNKIIFPGDSGKKQESLWAKKLRYKQWILILGHHGSNTSTGENLVSKMKAGSIAITSARKAKYGHPHFEVSKRLRAKKIPTLETQVWGNIHIQLD